MCARQGLPLKSSYALFFSHNSPSFGHDSKARASAKRVPAHSPGEADDLRNGRSQSKASPQNLLEGSCCTPYFLLNSADVSTLRQTFALILHMLSKAHL
eukprot:6174545-Pleurochrysis_carterae.AAC.2